MFNKLEARVLSEYKRSRAAPSTFCTLIKHSYSFIKHYIKHSKLSAYADDTQISYADKDPAKVEEVINSDLAKVDQWYKENRMQRNLSKYQAIVMGKTRSQLTSWRK